MKSTQLFARSIALVMVLGLVAAGCGSDKKATGSGGTTAAPTTAAPSGGPLTGMKGTTPLVDLSQDFKDRLLKVDPKLVDYNYGAESYDATIIIALAATQA